MADVFDKARDAVEQMKNSVNPLIQETMEQYKSVILDYQVEKQLYDKGEDSKGSIIRPAYSPLTVKIKFKKGQPTDRVTWKDTGTLYKTMRIIPKADSVEILLSVPYAKELLEKYKDNEVLGIQEELLKEFVQKYILPNLKKRYDTITKS